MSGGYGMAGHIGIGVETTWGTGVSATDFFKALSENLTLTKDRFEKENIVAGLYEPDDQSGVQRYQGDIVFAAYPTVLGYFLHGALGIESLNSAVGADMSAVEFTPRTSDANSLHPGVPFSMEIARDVGTSMRYDGVQINQLEMSIAPNQVMQITANVIAKNASAIAQSTPSFPTTPVDPFDYSTCSLSIDGGAVSIHEGVTITFNNQLEGKPALNATEQVARIKRTGPQQVRVSGSVVFEDHSEYDKFLNGSAQSVSIYLSRANSFSLLLEIAAMEYTAFPLGIQGREQQVVSFEGRGNYSTSLSRAIRATLTNVKSTYAL